MLAKAFSDPRTKCFLLFLIKTNLRSSVLTHCCNLASHLLQPRREAELLIITEMTVFQITCRRIKWLTKKKTWYEFRSLWNYSISRHCPYRFIAHRVPWVSRNKFWHFRWCWTASSTSSCKGLWATELDSDPRKLIQVRNYPKLYSCQQHTIFNTSLAFQVKLTHRSQTVLARQLCPNWDFHDFISREQGLSSVISVAGTDW